MQRYCVQKHAINKLRLEIPMVNEELVPMIDKWLEVAIQNKVQELEIYNIALNSQDYRLPEILFTASSLKVLRCWMVEIPSYQTMKLISLESFELHVGTIDEHMLRLMISSCPLIDLHLNSCSDLTSISMPWFGSSEMLGNSEYMAGGPVAEGTSTLRTLYYHGDHQMRPFEMNAGAFRNLRNLVIIGVGITDAILENLVSKLVMLETLVLRYCDILKCISISSSQIKNLGLAKCHGLQSVVVDAPHLISFLYSGIPDISLSVTCPEQCSHFEVGAISQVVSASWFIRLKKFLKETNIFKVLEVDRIFNISEVEFDEDEMRIIDIGSPYDLKELKLPFLYDIRSHIVEDTIPTLVALLDGLLYCCHPEVLSVTTRLATHNEIVEALFNPLKKKVKSWRHPLKHIEVEPADCSRLLQDAELELRFRLHW